MRWRLSGIAVLTAVLASLLVVAPSSSDLPTEAANASDFDPGHIISDEYFYDGRSMSEADIQGFLNAKSQGCAAGYTCLKDFRESTWTRSADPMCGAYAGAPDESSARIITKVAAACGISPKVLLVTLQKEQSLVTATAPTVSRFQRAMGYACPDTAPCDAQFFGFYNQVYKAAWQFKRYANPPGTSATFNWYPVGQVTQVRYHPNAACGTSPVRIANEATAALYYYTPYQPNAAALANLYGTGDSCSAYGNRNFWRFYTDWFGSTTAPRWGNLDSATPVRGGVQISGWSIDPSSTATSYIWVNVDGSGGPYRADKPRNWFEAAFPGYGWNHGFDELVPASPGPHEICVYGTRSILLKCLRVEVPYGAGAFDSAVATSGGIQISGWSVDFATRDPAYIWVNVDGTGGPYRADKPRDWFEAAFPGYGWNHGFDIRLPARAGPHQVCVYGANKLIGCKWVTVAISADGSLDTVEPVSGGVRLRGWSVDLTKPSAVSYIWVNVDGSGGPYKADVPLNWFNGHYPGAGPNHGFDVTVPATPGSHEICVYGTERLLRCQTVVVP